MKQIYNVIKASNSAHGSDSTLLTALAKHAHSIIACYGAMIQSCTHDATQGQQGEQDPWTRDGIPNIPQQQVLAQLGAIGLTMRFLDEILQGPCASITDHWSNKAITLMFRFLRQVVKANNVREHVALLEEHLSFLYKHLNSDFKVVDTLSELIADNPKLLQERCTPEFVSTITECMIRQHEEKLCGARFVNMLRIMCSRDGALPRAVALFDSPIEAVCL